jgi:anthranilate phosphoribosyltransferase
MTTSYSALAALARTAGGMTPEQTKVVLHHLMDGSLTPEHGAEVLIAWSERGETGAELATVVEALLAKAIHVPIPGGMDVCGTGGSGLGRFNVSTTAAFILAAAGIPVVKHGNKGSKTANGSFDLLEALGVPYQLPVQQLVRLQAETGVCFLFARAVHPAVGAVAPARKIAANRVKRTVFNLAGPLANPCRPRRQLIGVIDERTAHIVSEAIRLLGSERALVVRGHPGIDEVSITGPTHVWDIQGGHVHHAIIERIHQHGLDHAHLPCGDANANAAIFHRLLSGAERGPLLDMVCANAGAALDCWHGRKVLSDSVGFDQAKELVASGKAKTAFTRHLTMAKEMAEGLG